MEMIQRLSSSIAALLSNIEIPESLIKNLGNINYLRLLREIKWPLFLEDDDSLRTQLENLCEHYTKDYLKDGVRGSGNDVVVLHPGDALYERYKRYFKGVI